MDPFARYLKIFCLALVLGGLGFFCNFLFVYRADENTAFSQIAAIQARTNAIYGTALNPNDLKYKLELVKLRKPEIIALGSSRIMQLREGMFRVPFTNCGGVFSTLGEGRAFVESLLTFHKPKMIFFSIDYWWFNSAYLYDERRRFADETAWNQEKFLAPFEWIQAGKLTWSEYWRVILHGDLHNPYSQYKNLGVHALKTSNGFRQDGSYLDMKMIFGLQGNRAEKISEDIALLKAGNNIRANHGFDQFVDAGRLQEFQAILDIFHKANIPVVLFLPPVAPALSEELRKQQRNFVAALVPYLQSLGHEFYDFTDWRWVRSDNGEFLDAWHAGEVVYLRLLREILRLNPTSELGPYLRSETFDGLIEKFTGHTLVLYPGEENLFNQPE